MTFRSRSWRVQNSPRLAGNDTTLEAGRKARWPAICALAARVPSFDQAI
jgi:hypothetical protein